MSADGVRTVEEHHQFMNKNLSEVDVPALGAYNEVVEFHCFLARKRFLDRLGRLDERLITREQIDYGLRARLLGAKVTFEAASHVTYMAKRTFNKTDLAYLSFRWNDTQAIEAMRAFETNWGISIDKARVLNSWIRKHRARAYGTMFAKEYSSMTLPDFFKDIVVPQEIEALQRAARLRGSRQSAAIAEKPDPQSAERTLQAFATA
jgi:GT2 family glycosyltransferase